MRDYKVFRKAKKKNTTSYQFVECTQFSDIPGVINAALSVAVLGEDLVLAQKHNGWWDISGGKLEEGESVAECLYRENIEELGVHIDIDNLYLIGYIKAENSTNQDSSARFAQTNYMPVYIAFVKSIDRNWQGNKKEILQRSIASFKELPAFLASRGDGGQLNEILTHTQVFIKSLNLRYEFTFFAKGRIQSLDLPPVTQVMVFCKDEQDRYCIVRDYDENFYSLPGGGCELDESPLEGMKRELLEEAQLKGRNFDLLGTVIVDIYLGERIIASTQHLRYTCEISEINEFVPRALGSEIEERAFVKRNELFEKVMLLKNPTGIAILEKL